MQFQNIKSRINSLFFPLLSITTTYIALRSHNPRRMVSWIFTSLPLKADGFGPSLCYIFADSLLQDRKMSLGFSPSSAHSPTGTSPAPQRGRRGVSAKLSFAEPTPAGRLRNQQFLASSSSAGGRVPGGAVAWRGGAARCCCLSAVRPPTGRRTAGAAGTRAAAAPRFPRPRGLALCRYPEPLSCAGL